MSGGGKVARVLLHQYDARKQVWRKVQSEVTLEEEPFAEGAFRLAYRATLPWNGVPSVPFVCKFARDGAGTARSTYFADVEAHEVAQLYAEAFNAALPGKYPRVSYVPACVLEFVDRPGRPVCGAEQALQGRFRKYNNNVGAVCAQPPATARADLAEEALEVRARAAAGLPPLENWDAVATAQAFSHFSFVHSSSGVLICDIQGVGNLFTDPQVHTMSGKGFGLGNLGQTGIRAFMLRHTCTDHCRACGLPPIAPGQLNERALPLDFGASAGNATHAPPPGAGQGQGQGGAGQQQQQQRSMQSSASTAQLSMRQVSLAQQTPPFNSAASAQRVASSLPASSNAAAAARADSRESSARASPDSSPAASPCASPPSSVARTPIAAVISTPAHAAEPPPPKKPVGLDDTDEALMAAIMGD